MRETNRRFGVEIEMYPEDGNGNLVFPSFVANALREAGIDAYDAGYTHVDSDTTWKVVTDGSCGRHDGFYSGIEVVSPRLSGEQGIADLKKVCEVLHTLGMKITKECGLHVHVDGSGLSKRALAVIVMTYARYEKFFDAIQPPSRRSNGMCKSVTRFLTEFSPYPWAETDLRSFLARPVDCYHDDRYHKVNLCAYLRHGTVEFRQHSGTVEAEKIVPWVRFLIHFVETVKSWQVRTNILPYSFKNIVKWLGISTRSSNPNEREVYAYLVARFQKFNREKELDEIL